MAVWLLCSHDLHVCYWHIHAVLFQEKEVALTRTIQHVELCGFKSACIDNSMIKCYTNCITNWKGLIMKTAIYLPDELFEKVDHLAEELNVSRSRIFAEAILDYIEKLKNEEIFKALNRIYSEGETKEEITVREQSKKRYARRVKADKW